MKYWESVENDLPPVRTEKQRRSLGRKINLIMITLTVLSLSKKFIRK